VKLVTLVFLIILLGNSFFSQTGSLCFSFEYQNEDSVKLYRDDLFITSGKVEEQYICFDSLDVGSNYCFKQYREGQLLYQYCELDVKDNMVFDYTVEYIYGFQYPINNKLLKAKTKFVTIHNFNLSPSYRLNTDNDLLDKQFSFSYLSGENYLLSKNIEIGIKGGTSFSYADFKNDTSFTALTNVKRERYFSWDVLIEPTMRFSTNNRRDYNTKGLFLEFGARYHLPLLFRHVYVANDKKYTTSRLHQFNNVSGLVRVGYANFALMAQYRFFDFVKGIYPELPRLNVGISFVFTD